MLFEVFFVLGEFVTIGTEGLPPIGALCGRLGDVCLNHGRSILRLRNRTLPFSQVRVVIFKFKIGALKKKLVYLSVLPYILAKAEPYICAGVITQNTIQQI